LFFPTYSLSCRGRTLAIVGGKSCFLLKGEGSLGWELSRFSIVGVHLWFGLFDSIEFFFVLFEGDGEDEVGSGGRRAEQLVLNRLICALVAFLGEILALDHDSLAQVLMRQLVDQNRLVLLLLVLAPLQIQLLQLLAPQIQLALHKLIFHKLSLALSGGVAPAHVALDESVMEFLALPIVLLLSALDRLQLVVFLALQELAVEHVVSSFLLLLLLPLVALHGVLLKDFHVHVLLFLIAPL